MQIKPFLFLDSWTMRKSRYGDAFADERFFRY